MRYYIALSVLILLALFIAPPFADSQPATASKRVGVVLSGSPATAEPFVNALRDGLRNAGWNDGQNVILELRYAEGKAERLGELSAELARVPVDVIVTAGSPSVLAVKKATQTIPIVAVAVFNPAGTGLITPGGNVAGFDMFPAEALNRQLELLREAVPGLARLAVVWNARNPGAVLFAERIINLSEKARLRVNPVEVKDLNQLDGAFAGLNREGSQAIFLVSDPQFFVQRRRIVELIRGSGLPAMFQQSDFAEAGGLLAYGASVVDAIKQSATYIDRILKGTRPADLPVGSPETYHLVVNVGTAKAMGLTVPPSILARATKRIE